MNLIVPTVGQELGPTWAEDLNASLSLLDQHNHASGNGVQITPTGININADLPFSGNNAISLRSVRFSSQGSPLAAPADLGCLYESGVDLYYNDGNGVQIRLTSSGSPAGTPGSIANLVSPASVTYVPSTPAFVFQSAANTPADLDGGSLVLRNITANSNGVSLHAPPALAANYDVTFPAALPAAQSFVTLDNSGNLAAPINVTGGLTGSNIVTNPTFNGNVTITGNLTVQQSPLTLGLGVTVASFTSPFSGPLPVFFNGIYTNATTNAVIVARTYNTIDIYDSTLPYNSNSSHPIVVSANPNTSGLMIVRGVVAFNGAINQGEGFSVVYLGTGEYQVNFNQNFIDAPSVVATAQFAAGLGTAVYTNVISNSNFTLSGRPLGGGVPIDTTFSFIAIGQRPA